MHASDDMAAMMQRSTAFFLLAVFFGGCLTVAAADISGTVIVERRLTRPKITPSAPAYQRGVAVPLNVQAGDAKPGEDKFAFERSHVAIFIDAAQGPQSGATAETTTLQILQQDRSFVPDMVVVPVGSTVSFPNLDAIFHNIFSLSKPRHFDLGNYPKGETRTVTFPAPGVVYVYCHLHPNMSASIVVSPSKWCVKVGEDGHFVLPSVPPGKYKVTAWHKAAGFVSQSVTVTDDGAPPLRFLIPLTANGSSAVAAR
jgi:plastocyanin